MTLSPSDCNYLDASRVFVAFSKFGQYLEQSGVAIVSCGLPVKEVNWGFLKPPYDHVEAAAEAVQSYFGNAKLPYRLMYRSDQRHRVKRLESVGWQHESEPTPALVLRSHPRVRVPPAPLEVREVRENDELAAFRETAFRGFGYPVRAAHIFINAQLLALPYVRMYLGLLKGVPVATSMLVMSAGIAGIFWVATVAEYRGRGYGEALTWAAIAGGREWGCSVASLQASKLGHPVYTRMGFEHVVDYEYLHPAGRHSAAAR